VGLVGTYLVTALDGVAYGMLLFVVAAGLALIYGVLAELNLAHGSLYLIGGCLAYQLSDGSLPMLAAAAGLAVLLGAVGGAALAGLLHPLTGPERHLDQAMVTLGVAFVVADVITALVGATPLPIITPRVLDAPIRLGAHGYPAYRLVFIAVAALIALGLHGIIHHTTAGIMLRAVVADPAMAAATGIATKRVRVLAFAAGGGLATAGGVLGAPLLGPAPGMDTTVLVLSLIIVVLGGAGSIPATLAAALVVGQVQTLGVITAPILAPVALMLTVVGVLAARRPSGGTQPA
jgi:branched-subunit amino acid ABC-type transport system permease component